ncbi:MULTISPECIES: hypothetical protein [unclassified Bradyrhizobium]|uniref:ATP-dependent DNA ligase n=1 Tax=unclassified Bradyrhizobium TaxID=2631580 RepID=UPI00289B7E46|nr:MULTISPECIES: hypothetical protein [unclassified Bradyrhizobium]
MLKPPPMVKSTFFPCIPTRGIKVPAGPDWIHEIKHDGYRMIVQREGTRVRLFTRNDYDWSDKYPLVTEAALRIMSFVLDDEAVLLGVDGISDFDGLHSNDEVQFYAFDLLVTDGDNIRKLPLTMRKTTSPGCLRGVSTVSSSPTSNVARSGQSFSGTPALWGLRARCRSSSIDLTRPAGRPTG